MDKGYLFWLVEWKVIGVFFGFCGVKLGVVGMLIEGVIEIGWCFVCDVWGYGYVCEVV